MLRFLMCTIVLLSSGSWAMSIEVSGSTVWMAGDVKGDECVRLKEIIKSRSIDLVVLGDSNGGNANAGYCVGEAIRENKISTVIDGVCVSSCSRMWLGGVTRKLQGMGSAVGLHGNYSNGRLVENSVNRLREWIPRFAPQVDIELMNRWTSLFYGKHMMYFYNERASLCFNFKSDCEALKGRNVLNAGLGTQ